MKKFVLALTALAAFAGSAVAADLPSRSYPAQAPVIAPAAPSWTGFYIFGGGGYGLFDSETYLTSAAGTRLTNTAKSGGDGYYGTFGGGYDWQSGSWVTGVFGDGQWGSIKGSITDPLFGSAVGIPGGTLGNLKNTASYAVGARIGYLVAPNVLSYVNGGYSYAQFDGSTQSNVLGVNVTTTPSFHSNGWFLGGGVENSLTFFGLFGPGWLMKTEYRVAEYQNTTLPESFAPGIGTGLTGLSITEKPIVQTVGTSLVYRFNWGGTAVHY